MRRLARTASEDAPHNPTHRIALKFALTSVNPDFRSTNQGVPITSVLAAAYNESGVKVTFAQGSAIGGNDTSGFSAAVSAAQAADIVLFVGGDSGGLGWNMNTCGAWSKMTTPSPEFRHMPLTRRQPRPPRPYPNPAQEDDDRSELDLPGVQSDLLAALIGTGKPVIAALIHGRPVTFVRNNVLARVAALFAMWRPGEEGGSALMDLLTGRVSPSGRLAQLVPQTDPAAAHHYPTDPLPASSQPARPPPFPLAPHRAWVRSVGQVKSQASPWFSLLQGDFDRVTYNGDVIAGSDASIFAPWQPQFDFGYGLSYTTFKLELLGVNVAGSGASAIVTTTARVTNTGAAAAKQVVQVYYSMPQSLIVRYHSRLLAFSKTDTLKPGDVATLTIVAPAESFATYDPASRALIVEAGAYAVSVGASSTDIAGSAMITLSAAVIQ